MKNRLWKAGALCLALSMTLAGCGTYTSDSSDSSGSTESGAASSSEASSAETAAGAETSAAAETAETAETYTDDEITLTVTQPNTLNMIQSTSNLDSYVFYLTQEMLFRPYNGVWEPEVVDSFEADDTNTVYTYHLKDTTWPDGTAITAADFAYYLTAQLDPANGSANAQTLIDTYGFKNAQAFLDGECTVDEVGIQATDDSTLVITLEQPIADFDGTNIRVFPLSQSFVEEQGEALGGTAANYMSSGPYVLSDWTLDASLTFDKNDKFINADSEFPIRKVTFINTGEANTAVSMFEGGETDVILTVGKDYLDQLSDYLYTVNFSNVTALQMNVYGQDDDAKAALLSNHNFKLALEYALDREAIGSAIGDLQGVNRFLVDPVAGKTEGSLFEDDYPYTDSPVSGDADKAKEYLQAALEELGYSDVSQLPTLQYLTFENDNYRLIAETVQSLWKQNIGLENIEINLQPIPNAIQAMMSYQYDIYYTSLSLSQSPFDFLTYWTTHGAVNDITGSGMPLFSNEEYDSLVEEGRVNFDREARMDQYAQAEKILLDQAQLIPMLTSTNNSAVSDRVVDFCYNSTDAAIELNYTHVK